MKLCATAFGVVVALVGGAISQDPTIPAVPTGTPIPGDYNGPYRPQVHFTPPQVRDSISYRIHETDLARQHFMNDPNGMFLDGNGTYHLYYQYNPTATVAGNQHWGHATSRDLYHWINQPIAIFPPTSDSGVFSGSAVVDVNNTSGFFPDQDNGVVAIYTLNTPTAQVQEISYSFDGGFTFTAFAGNPVIDVG
ncbi:Invertase [Trametes pubescens]|uniref:Invertase n=1 Tax=Trametes pubescens TaxID=154538 RepID=A0A1M2VBK8_TRAPU|nr:Invertase [Trametes pubescens]